MPTLSRFLKAVETNRLVLMHTVNQENIHKLAILTFHKKEFHKPIHCHTRELPC